MNRAVLKIGINYFGGFDTYGEVLFSECEHKAVIFNYDYDFVREKVDKIIKMIQIQGFTAEIKEYFPF